ncbi:MAG: GMC family oxidoreductase [Candidatus Eremiobacteraeota bacterium]|nr:GMC family oxidoreductase [Candidatus Eremiobacteraeota bacterium]
MQDVLAALYETFAPDDAPTSGVQLLIEAVERLPERKRRELLTFLKLMQSPMFCGAVSGTFQTFAKLPRDKREKLLLRLANSPLAKLRTAFTAVKRLALFIAYSATDDEKSSVWARIGYPGPRNDRRATKTTPLTLTALSEIPDDVEIAVIGSGAGGGVAAAVLAQSGASVVVFEAGPAPDAPMHEQRELTAFAELYHESGTTANDDLSLAILAGACVGGGTTVNWTTSLRLEPRIVEDWHEQSGHIDFGDSLRPHYDAVSHRMSIAPESRHNANNATIGRGAESLGWHAFAQPRNAQKCGEECGYCPFGCAYGRKQGTEATFLHDAVKGGARVVAGAKVERIIFNGKRAAGFIVNGRTFHADRVIVACGSIETPRLLMRSEVRSPSLGRYLRLHPVAALFGQFAGVVETWKGPMQSMVCDEFSFVDGAYGFKLEAVPAHPGLAAFAVPWRNAREHRELMSRFRNAASLIVLVRDRGSGQVSSDGIRYTVDPYDANHLRLGMKRLSELLIAAGAHAIHSLHQRPVITSALEHSDIGENRMPLFSAHQMGTARMHREAEHGTVDEGGRVHGYDGLYVMDASVFPAASGVNPMLTVMAIAHRSATMLAGE